MREVTELKTGNSGKLSLTYGGFFTVATAYLVVPAVIFLMTYLKLPFAIVMSLCLMAITFLMIRHVRATKKASEKIDISLGMIIGSSLVIIAWCFLSGIGEFAHCTEDHAVRYAILNDLVKYKWPVFYDLSNQSLPEVKAIVGTDKVAFAYYFTFYMIPALIGKIFGLTVARVAILLWSALGLFLAMLGVAFFHKKMSPAILVIFIFFAGFDILPFLWRLYVQKLDANWEGWNYGYNIHGVFCQTMNVYNQSIPGWLLTILLLTMPDNKYVGTMGSLMFCYSPWATIGILPVAIYQVLRNDEKKDKKTFLKDLFGIGNIIIPIVIFISFAAFYSANSNATEYKGFSWKFFYSIGECIESYILYLVFEFGIWAAILFKSQRKNKLYWIVIATLVVLPVYQVSFANDFLMRGTLSPMFILMVMFTGLFLEKLEKTKANNGQVDAALLGGVIALLVAGLVPFLLIASTIKGTINLYNGKEEAPYQYQIVSFGDMSTDKSAELCDKQFFVHDYEDALFFKYLGKVPKDY